MPNRRVFSENLGQSFYFNLSHYTCNTFIIFHTRIASRFQVLILIKLLFLTFLSCRYKFEYPNFLLSPARSLSFFVLGSFVFPRLVGYSLKKHVGSAIGRYE